jgi:tetratricopeptide (TPR) repeat protein
MNYRSILLVLALGTVGCSTPFAPPEEEHYRDPVLVQFDSSARAALADGSYERAARFYELALGRARTADLGLEVAKAAYNRGACLLLLKRPVPARAALQESAAEFARLRRDPSPAWLLEARAARQLGDAEGATERMERVLALGRDDDVRLQAWLIKGGLAADAGQVEAARQALTEARRLLRDDPALRAGVAALSGQIALAEQRPADAGLQFDKEAAFLQRAARWFDMAEALRRSGEAYQKAEQPGVAAVRFYRSARSLYGQGQLVPALQAMERAVDAAGRAGDNALAADAGRLLEEIRHAVGVAQAVPPVE